ncbi:hypothetical protein BDA96_03G350900 [Sorghum bicolor]|jgi:hypothetical protein|uniref:Uncharacterized protein n=2 Tax=Sorghum bicolor TaxID=4558 RepID=A0A921RGE2_SORBI|nr:hypothetical protein BDA96_03G350900 [Sorghum bicolor]KXG33556.1 hypothetical protein SORBI_3003G325600 [Sorghum bicolor]
MANDSLRAFLVLLVAKVCFLVAMAASAVQGRPGPAPMVLGSVPACCLSHPECCYDVASPPGDLA